MRISDWSSDVCSSDLEDEIRDQGLPNITRAIHFDAEPVAEADLLHPQIGARQGDLVGQRLPGAIGLLAGKAPKIRQAIRHLGRRAFVMGNGQGGNGAERIDHEMRIELKAHILELSLRAACYP